MTNTERQIMTLLKGQDDLLQRSWLALSSSFDEASIRARILPSITFCRAGWGSLLDVYGSKVTPSIKTAMEHVKTGLSRVRNLLREKKNAAARDKIVEVRNRFVGLLDAVELDTGFSDTSDEADDYMRFFAE